MNGDLISREAIIKILMNDLETGDDTITISWLKTWLEMQPAVEDPRKRELKHFLEFEIERTIGWLEDKTNPCYNGVEVGSKEAKELQKRHIKFCEQLLKMI